MNEERADASEVAAMWRALSLLARVFEAPPRRREAADDVTSMLQRLVRELGRQMDADRAVVALGEVVLRWTRRAGARSGKQIEVTAEEVASPRHLYVPVLRESEVVGALEFMISRRGVSFRPADRSLLRLVAAYLGISIHRQVLAQAMHVLEGQKQDLADATMGHHRRHSMLYRLWQHAQSGQADREHTLTVSLNTICHGIPCSVGTIIVSNTAGQAVAEVINGLDDNMLKRLKRLCGEMCESVLSDGVAYRALRRRQEAERMKPLRYALMARVSGPNDLRAIVALARGAREREFTTVERQALQIACALVRWDQ